MFGVVHRSRLRYPGCPGISLHSTQYTLVAEICRLMAILKRKAVVGTKDLDGLVGEEEELLLGAIHFCFARASSTLRTVSSPSFSTTS